MLLEEKYPEVTAPAELLPLSLQILRFKMAGWRRKLVRRGEHEALPVEELPIADLGPDPSQAAERREQTERLVAVLAKLGDRCRELFRLKLEGKSFAEIQEILGANSINTVYTWDARCRKELLGRLGGRWEQER